ncbi:MAG: phosphatase PAP2 family protein [Chitinispirillaceae bacterium]
MKKVKMVETKSKMLCVSLILIFAISVGSVHADDTLEISPRIDIPLLAATGGVGAGIALIRAERFIPVDFKGQKQLINPIDRPFAGIYRPEAAGISDATLAATILASPVFLAFTHNQPNSFVDGLFLVTESFAICNFLLQITKTAVSRPRPLMYADDLPFRQRARADNFLSFFSGHAAVSFSFATTTTMVFAASDLENSLKAATAATSFSLATATAILRVAAGKHFITDVVSGALIGVATSMIVIELHKKVPQRRLTQGEGSATVFSLSLPL